MASTLMVPVVKIKNVRIHPKAAMLGLVDVLGYQMVTGLVEDPKGNISRKFLKGQLDDKGKRIPVTVPFDGVSGYTEDKDGNKNPVPPESIEEVVFSFRHKEDELVVYLPSDTIITDELADRFGVKSLLKGGNRIGKISLRGEPSFGLVVSIPDDKRGVWQEGDNVAEYFNAKKYEPPVKTTAGDAAKYDPEIDPFFDKFTDIQNGRIFVGVLGLGEEVVATEKLHGTNCRVACVKTANGWVETAGSMELRRKKPEGIQPGVGFDENAVVLAKSTYWFPWSMLSVANLFPSVANRTNANIVELFGEVYGNSIQKGFKYDAGAGIGFKAFGLKVNDKFLDWDEFEGVCKEFGVPIVPVLYKGPFDMAKILAMIEVPTTLGDAPVMEGCVVVPAKERIDPKIGRVALKYVSYQYDLLKNKPDSKDV